MLKRTISGAFFIAIITAFFFLREIHVALFNVLIWFFCALGTFEVARAVKGRINKYQFITAIVSGCLLIPIYSLTNYVLWIGNGFAVAFGLIAFCCVLSLVFGKNKSLYYGVLPIVYPSIFCVIMALCNHLNSPFGLIALLLTFVVSPCCDTFAYLVGMAYSKIKKGNVKKLCPKLSPKKTWAGAIGGVVGGIAGAMVLYLIFKNTVSLDWWLYLIMGALASVLTQIGDLFESSIKRSVGIKDMGKIMPGHGGVMDRIDGIVFATVFVYLIFLAVV